MQEKLEKSISSLGDWLSLTPNQIRDRLIIIYGKSAVSTTQWQILSKTVRKYFRVQNVNVL